MLSFAGAVEVLSVFSVVWSVAEDVLFAFRFWGGAGVELFTFCVPFATVVV